MVGTKRTIAVGLSFMMLILLLSACATADSNDTGQKNTEKSGQTADKASTSAKGGTTKAQSKDGANGKDVKRIGMLQVTDKEARIPTRLVQGRILVPLGELLQVIGYQMTISEDNKEIWIGGIDPLYKLTIGSNKAEREGETLLLSEAPVIEDEKVYLPESTLIDLFERDIRYMEDGTDLKLSALTDDDITMDNIEDGDAPEGPPFFGEDPDDPLKDSIMDVGPGKLNQAGSTNGGIRTLAAGLPNIDIAALIQTAMKYRGVPYLFGAGPYSKTRRFDCSSFTQYVFGKYGVRLNRVSRNQGTQGIFVGRANLQKGDLVFFSVPGRFKTDNVIGHVGIYIGGGNMIHTYGAGGVHVSSMNSGSWSKRYIRARRVAY
ncbi:cell wall-associated NlpC family hydrolase [Paenibacillus phyllosphaerae]|uniref:Cell wall-associated NlpC family hydrolase n=1 Tax=Paenibacillus phyllosphaerae TaxID=274593 RepID=A0A7W5B2Q4_9BACL|nr:C40 family peptidase [Paenibacillus phyllosphaerae]MBB3112551.1 cell wall-associated NlpC family hydrolase [Paenibacillus phyllosphaerae]